MRCSAASNLVRYLVVVWGVTAVKIFGTVSDSGTANNTNSSFAIRLQSGSRTLEKQVYDRVKMDCPMFDALPEGRVVGAYHADKCVGSGNDGEVWKASAKMDSAEPVKPVVLKVLNVESDSSAKAKHECSFAASVYSHMPDKVVNCLGTIDEQVSGQRKFISIFELADGKDVGEWLQESGGKAPTLLPDLKSTFRLALDIWDAVITLERGFGQVRYMHDDHHLGNVILSAAGSWKLIDYGRSRICCGTDPTDCAPVKVSPILKFANWLVLVTNLGPDVMSWPEKVQAVYLGAMRGVPAVKVTASEALQEFLPTIKAAYLSDFRSVEANTIVEKGFTMMLLDRSDEVARQRVNELSLEIKSMAEAALARLETPTLVPIIKSALPAEVIVTFKPGPIGIAKTGGVVEKVYDEGQADSEGVQANWTIKAVNGLKCEVFADDIFQKAKAGNKPYQVTFSKAAHSKVKHDKGAKSSPRKKSAPVLPQAPEINKVDGLTMDVKMTFLPGVKEIRLAMKKCGDSTMLYVGGLDPRVEIATKYHLLVTDEKDSKQFENIGSGMHERVVVEVERLMHTDGSLCAILQYRTDEGWGHWSAESNPTDIETLKPDDPRLEPPVVQSNGKTTDKKWTYMWKMNSADAEDPGMKRFHDWNQFQCNPFKAFAADSRNAKWLQFPLYYFFRYGEDYDSYSLVRNANLVGPPKLGDVPNDKYRAIWTSGSFGRG